MLTLRHTEAISSMGSVVVVTDATGTYASPSNLGGWGSPNPDLNKTALVALAQLSTPDGVTTSVSGLAFNAADNNSTVRTISLQYPGDGHEKIYLFAVQATNNGVTSLSGHTIATGEYYYLTTDGKVYQKAASGPDTLITDYSVLVGVGAITQTMNDKIFFNQLTIKKELEYYRLYRDARSSSDNEQADYYRKILDDLTIDIDGAFWQFSAGLFTQAEDIVAQLVEKHGIINGNIIPVV